MPVQSRSNSTSPSLRAFLFVRGLKKPITRTEEALVKKLEERAGEIRRERAESGRSLTAFLRSRQ